MRRWETEKIEKLILKNSEKNPPNTVDDRLVLQLVTAGGSGRWSWGVCQRRTRLHFKTNSRCLCNVPGWMVFWSTQVTGKSQMALSNFSKTLKIRTSTIATLRDRRWWRTAVRETASWAACCGSLILICDELMWLRIADLSRVWWRSMPLDWWGFW